MKVEPDPRRKEPGEKREETNREEKAGVEEEKDIVLGSSTVQPLKVRNQVW